MGVLGVVFVVGIGVASCVVVGHHAGGMVGLGACEVDTWAARPSWEASVVASRGVGVRSVIRVVVVHGEDAVVPVVVEADPGMGLDRVGRGKKED